jgi:hypothetical protein
MHPPGRLAPTACIHSQHVHQLRAWANSTTCDAAWISILMGQYLSYLLLLSTAVHLLEEDVYIECWSILTDAYHQHVMLCHLSVFTLVTA